MSISSSTQRADNTDFVATARITDIAGNAAGPVSDSARLLLSEPGAPIVAITEDADNNRWINAAELNGDIDVSSITLPRYPPRVGDSLLVSINGVAPGAACPDARRHQTACSIAAGRRQSGRRSGSQRQRPGSRSRRQPRQDRQRQRHRPIPCRPTAARAPTVTITEDADNNGYINAAELNGDVDVKIASRPGQGRCRRYRRPSPAGTITREITVNCCRSGPRLRHHRFHRAAVRRQHHGQRPASSIRPATARRRGSDSGDRRYRRAEQGRRADRHHRRGRQQRRLHQPRRSARRSQCPASTSNRRWSRVGDIVRVTDGNTTP